jgi:hypothetical protein
VYLAKELLFGRKQIQAGLNAEEHNRKKVIQAMGYDWSP